MSNNMKSSLLTLPVELVYRILDNLNGRQIFFSLSNVCTRINAIIHSYQPYKVYFYFIAEINFSCPSTILYSKNIHIHQSSSLFSLVSEYSFTEILLLRNSFVFFSLSAVYILL